MLKKLLLLAGVIGSLLAIPTVSFAASNYNALCPKVSNGVCTEGPCATAEAAQSPTCKQAAQQVADANNTNPITGNGGVLQVAINIIAALAGIVAVIMVIVGGMNFITSNGNPENVKKARTRIISALIGAAVVALSWTILSFVNNKFIN